MLDGGKKYLLLACRSSSDLTQGLAEGPEASVDLVINSLNYSGSCGAQRGRKGIAQQGVLNPELLSFDTSSDQWKDYK